MKNDFLEGIRASRLRTQVGLWCSLGSSVTTEICAGAGFDWLLLDMEHAPNEVRDILAQLQAASSYPTSCVVRPDSNDPVRIKRLLDIGVQSLLIPQVDSKEAAMAAVRATRYPLDGNRGLTLTSRASSYGRSAPEYLAYSKTGIAVIVQIESRAACQALESIAGVPGVDAVFIGPSDLSADMGFLGNPRAAEVRSLIDEIVERLRAIRKPWGILAGNDADIKRYKTLGASFIAVGSDQGLLASASTELANRHGTNGCQTGSQP